MKNWLWNARAVANATRRASECSTGTHGLWGGRLRAPCLAALAAISLAPAALGQYCTAGSHSCLLANQDERISEVKILDSSNAVVLDNPEGNGNGGAGCYSAFLGQTANLLRSGTYTISVFMPNYYNGDIASVWVDWNQDGTFASTTGATGEQVNLTPPVGADGSAQHFTGTFTVPATATLGSTRLRVRVSFNDVAMSPCGNLQGYGEVEDYTAVVIASGACCNASGGCTVSASNACSGVFQGAATVCSPVNPCVGACCSGTICSQTTSAGCAFNYHGGGSTCSPVNACAPVYCTASAADCADNTADERISQFMFNDIVNPAVPDTSGAPTGCYTDWTAISTTVFPGQTYNVALHNPAPFALDQADVWIDWNQDGTFDTSSEQTILTIDTDSGSTLGSLFTGTVTVPANALLGSTRLRVRIVYNTAATPCGTSTYGETEDYTVNVQAPTVGACCAAGASGACSTTTPGACSGAFQGLASSCSPSNPCGGACCNSGGNCTVTTAATCPSGSTYGDHLTCGSSPCNGACCDASSGACTSTISSACSGTFNGMGSTCSSNPCVGACCDPNSGACTASATAGCGAGTTYQGIASACGGTPSALCGQGACCDNNTAACTLTTIGGCAGTFQAAGAACGTGICPAQACCSPSSGACTVIGPAGACTGDGTPQGLGSSCTPNACPQPPPPANDDCGTVFTSGPTVPPAGGTVSGTLLAATPDGAAACGAAGGFDVYFTFTPATDGAWNFTTCTGSDAIDTVLSVHTGCPTSAANQVAGACNDDSCGALSNIPSVSLSANTTYIVRVALYIAGDTPGAFSLTVNPLVPIGTCCDNVSGACTTIVTGSTCATGTTAGNGTSCTTGACPSTGACCRSDTGSCQILLSSSCNGTYGGDNSSCAGLNCPNMSCGSDCPPGAACSSTNGGFETGDFTGWTTGGNFEFSAVDNMVFDTFTAHGGTWFTYWGAVGTPATIQQTIPAHAGDHVNISFWYGEYNGGVTPANSFIVTFDGNQIFQRTNDVDTPWTQFTFGPLTVSADNPVLMFSAQNDPTYFFLDDVSVCVTPAATSGGVCCRGATCSTAYATAAACAAATPTHAGSANPFYQFIPTTSVCNTPPTPPATVGNARTPCCFADYNHNAGIEVQDIFDFLNDWFAGRPMAIPSGSGDSGTLNVQNIFDFLNAWFVGC